MSCIVILTALTVEYEAIRSYLIDLQDDKTPEGVIYERGKFAANGKIWEIGIAEVGVGNIKATRETQRAISHFNPDILFFVGIAGGIKDVKIGDVVVAEDVIYYESGKVTEPDVFQSRPKIGKSAFALVERAKNVARKGDWLQRLANSPDLVPNVKVAPIVAGEKVLASRESDLFRLIRERYNDVIAVEMEAYGFLSATFAYPEIKSIIIRGISDLVAGKNDDSVEPEEERQAKASHHACAFALELLTKFDPEAGARDPISQPNLNFLGREEAIEYIKEITDQSKQIIVAYADSGVGKTTLAENFFELDKSYKQLLKIDDISMDGTTTAEEVLNKLLKQLDVDALTRSSEFQGNLNLLEQKLIERGLKTGVFIDNIEPLLDKNGKFVDNKYEDLFLKISCLPIKHLLLFTSCISLKFENNNLNYRIENYHLDNLPFTSWQYFFRENEIPFEDKVLEDIHDKCRGNAKVMNFLRGIIKKDYDNSLNDFWTNKSGITNSKELIEKYLNDFRNIDPNAYELLCYLECYNIAKIPDRHVRRLADDISGLQNSKLAIALEDRCILEVKTDTYYLHKLFRREVCDRLQSTPADIAYWREVNRKVANLYHEDAKDLYKDESNRIDAAFEAFDYYYEAQEFEECHDILLQILEADKEIENLRCSQNLWRYMDKVVNKCEKLRKNKSDRLSNLSKAITLIPLGVLYSEIGKTHEAVEVRNDILAAIKNIDLSSNDIEKKIFAEVSAYLISARSCRIIGDLKLAELDSEKAIQLVDKYHSEHIISDNKMYSLKSLSVYERGNVHLEKAKLTDSSKEAQKAFSCFTRAAYLALNEKKVPNQAYIVPIISLIYSSTKKFQGFAQDLIKKILSKNRIKARKTNELKNKDYTKYFRVLFNAAQCLRLMRYTPFDYLFLIEAKRRLPRTDDLNNAWVCLELALHSSKRKNYELALSLRDKGNLEALCSTSVLFNYGNFMYESEEYRNAMNKYLELKDFLDLNKIGFESLKCNNYQRICLTWLRLKENGEEKHFPNLGDAVISDYLNKCISIYETFDLYFYEQKIYNLESDMDGKLSN
jgi:nucleoside phosphorylase